MPPPYQIRLGGFKILEQLTWISLTEPEKGLKSPAQLCRLFAEKKINSPFFTCGRWSGMWRLNIAIDSNNASKALPIVKTKPGKERYPGVSAGILSLFPHKNNLEITSRLLNAFGKSGIEPEAIAHSSSAVSVVLLKELIPKAVSALFDSFSFSAYQSPADWKLTQKGNNVLYREVVASYQEKRPKVYFLELKEAQELLRINLNSSDHRPMGKVFNYLARSGCFFSFLTWSRTGAEKSADLFLCLSEPESGKVADLIREELPRAIASRTNPVTLFSMTGPHFGDRYGIASELLSALESDNIDLMALNCSIASITGVVPAGQTDPAIHAIKKCFEVPSVVKKQETA